MTIDVIDSLFNDKHDCVRWYRMLRGRCVVIMFAVCDSATVYSHNISKIICWLIIAHQTSRTQTIWSLSSSIRPPPINRLLLLHLHANVCSAITFYIIVIAFVLTTAESIELYLSHEHDVWGKRNFTAKSLIKQIVIICSAYHSLEMVLLWWKWCGNCEVPKMTD